MVHVPASARWSASARHKLNSQYKRKNSFPMQAWRELFFVAEDFDVNISKRVKDEGVKMGFAV